MRKVVVAQYGSRAKAQRFGRNHVRGVSLIEALVTVVLLGVALLGMAMLHAQSFKFSTGSYARTQANLLAYEITDRMRVTAMGGSVAMSGYVPGSDPGGTCKITDPVATADLIANDLRCWHKKIRDTLPGATASIASGDNVVFTITINWLEQSIRLDGNNQSQLVMTFQPSPVPTAS